MRQIINETSTTSRGAGVTILQGEIVHLVLAEQESKEGARLAVPDPQIEPWYALLLQEV